MKFLNQDGNVYTASRNDGNGNPVTDVHIKGTRLAQQFTQLHAVKDTLTFTSKISYIGIYNTDAVNEGVFNVNGIDIYVPAEEYVEFCVGGTARNTVTISGSTSYIVSRFD